jgi:hypothetical protein
LRFRRGDKMLCGGEADRDVVESSVDPQMKMNWAFGAALQ